MSEIKCPHCGKVFSIDEADFASIAQQVRDSEFHKELEERAKLLTERAASQAELEKTKLQSEISALQREQEAMRRTHALELRQARTEAEVSTRDAMFEKEKQIADLEAKLSLKDAEYQIREKNLEDSHKKELALLNEQVEYYKDFKAKQSTKMIGESLEQYCHDEFDKVRATAFPKAYFEKDNLISATGSKGDFIFRDYDEHGTEIISIMFEMKNEADTTDVKSRHTNESFLKELDKDRREKGCEYAVLVSLLESDSDLYNTGIVDKSHRFPKMYVIRPQFFIPIITTLRNAALNAMDYKNQLIVARQQNIDVENFENELNDFKHKFSDHYNRATKRFSDAIADIDKTIAYLEKVKANLQGSEYSLTQALKRADDLTIKRLTRNSPSVRQSFEEIKEAKKKE